jgi:Carboxypeptidase regulatory-like domain
MMQDIRSKRAMYLPFLAVLLIVVAGSIQAPAYGQVLYGSLVGTVTDPSGGVVPNATVSVVDTQNGQTREEMTDSGGRYSLVYRFIK